MLTGSGTAAFGQVMVLVLLVDMVAARRRKLIIQMAEVIPLGERVAAYREM